DRRQSVAAVGKKLAEFAQNCRETILIRYNEDVGSRGLRLRSTDPESNAIFEVADSSQHRGDCLEVAAGLTIDERNKGGEQICFFPVTFVGFPHLASVEMFQGDVLDPRDVTKFFLHNRVDSGPVGQRNGVEAFTFEDYDRCVVALETDIWNCPKRRVGDFFALVCGCEQLVTSLLSDCSQVADNVVGWVNLPAWQLQSCLKVVPSPSKVTKARWEESARMLVKFKTSKVGGVLGDATFRTQRQHFPLVDLIDSQPLSSNFFVHICRLPTCDAICPTEDAFPGGNWKAELAGLSDISDRVEVIKIVASKCIGGVCSVVAGMNPKKVTDVAEIIERMPDINQRIVVAAAETPLRDLDIANAMIVTTEGISHAVYKKIENEVANDVKEGAMTNSVGRMIESYNSAAVEELKNHWKKHEIERLAPYSPTSKFELLFASVSTTANIPSPISLILVLSGAIVLYLEVDVEMHRSLELLHYLREQACSKGRGTSFGLHTGPSSCLNLSVVALATFFKRSDLCSLPLSDVFVFFCDHGTCAYNGKEKSLPLTAFCPTNTNQFELSIHPIRELHSIKELNEICVLILSAAAQMLERYAKFLKDGVNDDSEKAEISCVFDYVDNTLKLSF
ncbi:hypothetical protein PanWU01x14_109440, partial [Parasponia andersonii]